MKRLLFAGILILVSGCIASPTMMREKRVASYKEKNPDVSSEVIDAITERQLLSKMTMDQVKLSWGKPGKTKVIKAGGGKDETIWYYYDSDGTVGGLDTSSLFAMDVPAKRVNFDSDGKVEEWKIYDEELGTSRITAMTKTLPTSVMSGGKGQNVVRAGSYYGWPYIILSSTKGKGAEGTAVLNGRTVRIGESIKDVTLTAVGSHGVKLQFKDQVGILKKGETTQ
jgi:hypothetical protein